MKGVFPVVVPLAPLVAGGAAVVTLAPLVVFDTDDLVVASVVVSQAVVQLPTVELQFPDHV